MVLFSFAVYLELLHRTGRILREDKPSAISANLPPMLQRLHIQPERWLRNCKHLKQDFRHVIGPITRLEQLCEKLNQRWLHGLINLQRKTRLPKGRTRDLTLMLIPDHARRNAGC